MNRGLIKTSTGYDAPAHMTEELKNARREAPRAIVMAVYVGAFTGFIVRASNLPHVISSPARLMH